MIDPAVILAQADAGGIPQLPADASWAGVMLILILGLLLASTAIGFLVKANIVEQPPAPDPCIDDAGAAHQG